MGKSWKDGYKGRDYRHPDRFKKGGRRKPSNDYYQEEPRQDQAPNANPDQDKTSNNS